MKSYDTNYSLFFIFLAFSLAAVTVFYGTVSEVN